MEIRGKNTNKYKRFLSQNKNLNLNKKSETRYPRLDCSLYTLTV